MKSKVKEAIEKEITKEGLPKEAFAIVGDPQDPETWKLHHHTKAIFRALQGTGTACRQPSLPSAPADIGGRGSRPRPRTSSRPPVTWLIIMRRPGSPSPTPWAP